MDRPPGRPPAWQGPLVELERVETEDPAEVVALLAAHGLAGEPATQRGDVAVALLLGSRGCARLGGLPEGAPSPVAVPECVAVAYRRANLAEHRSGPEGRPTVGPWTLSWTDQAHGAAVEQVRAAIGRGDVYQANVVGHRHAPFTGDPTRLARAVAALPGAAYAGFLNGEGWTVASASPEQLVRIEGDRVSTIPIKGTARDRDALVRSIKDRAEHIMIVDLERNDLARVARTGTVEVERLYDPSVWAGLWHASTTVEAQLAVGAGVTEVLRAVLPGGSVTGAPKYAACQLLAGLEPVGRGPAMGGFGFVWPGGLDLGLTIRTVALAEGQVHVWAGGGITWGSEPDAEVAEAHAKAGPVLRALAHA